MMEAVSTSEMSVSLYQTTRCNIPEDSHFYDYFPSHPEHTFPWTEVVCFVSRAGVWRADKSDVRVCVSVWAPLRGPCHLQLRFGLPRGGSQGADVSGGRYVVRTFTCLQAEQWVLNTCQIITCLQAEQWVHNTCQITTSLISSDSEFPAQSFYLAQIDVLCLSR
jgi:hypothetical protein